MTDLGHESHVLLGESGAVRVVLTLGCATGLLLVGATDSPTTTQ